MPIQRSATSVKNKQIINIQENIESILTKDILEETPEIKKKFQSILLDLKNVRFDTGCLKMLDGDILDDAQIRDLIIAATGYDKWQIAHNYVLEKNEVEDYKNNYSIDFKEQAINCYRYYRCVRSRYDIWLLKVTVFPGYFHMILDTGRANYDLKGLLTEKELIDALRTEFGNYSI